MSSHLIDKCRSADAPARLDPRVLEAIRLAVGGIRFGSVEIVIHEGRVVQIERREKVRWEEASADRIHSGG